MVICKHKQTCLQHIITGEITMIKQEQVTVSEAPVLESDTTTSYRLTNVETFHINAPNNDVHQPNDLLTAHDDIFSQLSDLDELGDKIIAVEEGTYVPEAAEASEPAEEKAPQVSRTKRVLGRFATKLSGLKQSASNAANYAGAKFGIATQTAAGTVGSGIGTAKRVYKNGMEKMSEDEEDSRKGRIAKRMGRAAMKVGLGVGIIAGAAAAYGGYRAAAGTIDHIVVPGTGSAPDHNIIQGNSVTLGYEAGAAPLVGETPYNMSVGSGVQKLLDTFHNTGGGSKTLEGYSQGADVVREAVSKMSPQEQSQLILKLGGDPSGEKGILTLAHDSPQGQLMGLLGFDTSPLKDTGGATVNEIRVTNDIMADASYTVADAKQFNSAVESGDIVGALRMLANTGEKGGGYATTHSGLLQVLPQDRVSYNPNNPGNATVMTERTADGTLTTINPNVTAGEGLLANYTGIRLTPEAREAYEAVVNPNVSNEQVVQEVVDAVQEGVSNTTWLPPEVRQGFNGVVDGMSGMMDQSAPAPQNAAPAPVWNAPAAPAAAAPVQEFIQQAAPAVQEAVKTFVPPAQQGAVNNFLGQFGIK